MYQNKTDDKVLTPAHLLLLPLDASNMINYMSFRDIGLNTLNESASFSKIRNATKLYNSHLIHTPSAFTSKYNYLNSAYVDENSFLTTSSFGVKKQHNNASSLALGNPASVLTLDSNSFNKFLNSTLGTTSPLPATNSQFQQSPSSLLRAAEVSSTIDITRASTLTRPTGSGINVAETRIGTYPSLLNSLNSDSDKAGLSQPSSKINSTSVSAGSLNANTNAFISTQLTETASLGTEYANVTRGNIESTPKEFNLSGPNSKVLANDQSIRSLPAISANKSNFNLSPSTNTLASNNTLGSRLNKPVTPLTCVESVESGNIDYTLFNKLGSSRSLMVSSHPSVLSSATVNRNSLDYDRSSPIEESTASAG